jgi:uridine kinase
LLDHGRHYVQKIIAYFRNNTVFTGRRPLFILITGGAAAGKTTLAQKLKEHFEQNQQEVLILPLDRYYNYSPLLFQSRDPIPHKIFQWEELNKDLKTLLAGKSIYLPTHDSSEERLFVRSKELANSAPVIIVEGMLAFYNEDIRKKSDLKIFLEVAEDIRLERRLKRYKQGLDEGKFSKPIEFEKERFYNGRPKENHKTYVEPAKKYADLVIEDDNMENVVEKINQKLKKKRIGKKKLG